MSIKKQADNIVSETTVPFLPGKCEQYEESLLRINAAYQRLQTHRRVMQLELSDLRRHLEYLNSEIDGRDIVVERGNAEIARLHTEITHLHTEIARRNSEIENRDSAIATLTSENGAFRMSTSWLITKPLRMLSRMLRRLGKA